MPSSDAQACHLGHLPCQGALDPLNDARGRAKDLVQLCPDHATCVLLDAGHCPHDEVPELVSCLRHPLGVGMAGALHGIEP